MSAEEIQAMPAVNAALCAEVTALQQQVAELRKQLQAALVRPAEMEQEKTNRRRS